MSEKTLWDAMHQVGYVCGIIGNFDEEELKSVRNWCQWRIDHDFTKPEPSLVTPLASPCDCKDYYHEIQKPVTYGEGIK